MFKKKTFKSFVALNLLALGLLTAIQSESEGSIQFGAASQYGILINAGTKNAEINSGNNFTNIGVGTGTNEFKLNNPATLTGDVDFADPFSPDLFKNNTTHNGVVSYNQSQVSSALSTVSGMTVTFAGQTGSSISLNGGETITAGMGNLVNGNRIFDLSGDFDLNNSLTIQGTASDFFIFNISGKAKFDEDILLDGITSDQVLWNLIGDNGEVKSGNKATIYGTILAMERKFNMNSVQINGRIFGGKAGQDFKLVSNFQMSAPASSPIPEPGSIIVWSLIGFGFLMIGQRTMQQNKRLAVST